MNRWLARASFLLMLAAAGLLLGFAGWRSLTMIVFAAAGVCAVLAGGYWFLAHRGLLRWVALLLVIAAPVFILIVFALHSLLWVAIVAVALMLAAAGTAQDRPALRPGPPGRPRRARPRPGPGTRSSS